MRVILLLLISFCGYCQTLTQIPYPFIATPQSTTEIFLTLTGTDATSYTIQRSTSSTFTSVTDLSSEGYNGTDLTYVDDGLTINTTYYYRAKALYSGLLDSEWVTYSCKTISVMPIAFYIPAGINYDVDNQYGDTDNASPGMVLNFKSVINTSGPTTTFRTSKGAITDRSPFNSTSLVRSNSTGYTKVSTMTFTGTFTFIYSFRYDRTSDFVNSALQSDSTVSTDLIRFEDNKSVLIFGSGTNTQLFWKAPLVKGQNYEIVFQRNASNILRCSNDGGKTWTTATTTNAGQIDINRLFATTTPSGYFDSHFRLLGFYDVVLTYEQIRQAFDLLTLPYQFLRTPVDQDNIDLPAGLSWTDIPVNGYITNSDFDGELTSSLLRDRIIVKGRYAYLLTNYKNETPTYQQDALYIIDTDLNKYAGPILFPIPSPDEDVHNNGSIADIDRTIFHIEQEIHYGGNESKPFVMRNACRDYDLREFTLVQNLNGFADTGTQQQYHQFVPSWDIVFYTQEGTNNSPWINVWHSKSRGIFYAKRRVADAGTTDWFYPFSTGNKDTTYLFLNYLDIDATPDRYPNVFLLKTHDHRTYYNMDKTWTKSVLNSSATVSELTTNAIFTSATSTNNAIMPMALVDQEDGELYGIASNGLETGFDFFYSVGNSITKKNIDFGGRTVNITQSILADQCLTIWKVSDTEYHVMVYGTNSGNWQLEHYKTEDKGDTWSFVAVENSDTTKKHQRMIQNKIINNNKVIIAASRLDSSSAGTLWIKIFEW